MSNKQNITVNCPNCKKTGNISKLSFTKKLFFCDSCNNGFLYPIPKNLGKYYPPAYWQYPGQLSSIRAALHNLLQQRRKRWLKKYLNSGKILDVGAGEGIFGKILEPAFKVTNLESSFSSINNKQVIKADFLKWQPKEKYAGVVFLESLEHVPSPQDYLKKAASLLKEGGYIFIECPRFDCWESKFFKNKWLHLDIPRHLAHFTRKGLVVLASRNNLKTVSQTGMLVYEFSPYCFVVSLMHLFGMKPLNLRKRSISNFVSILLTVTFFPLAIVAETIFHLFDQDPIELAVFQKV